MSYLRWMQQCQMGPNVFPVDFTDLMLHNRLLWLLCLVVVVVVAVVALAERSILRLPVTDNVLPQVSRFEISTLR